MNDGLTESVARLYRAGSEHSQQTVKLRKAVDSLLSWMDKNLPTGFVLPCDCKLWPSGEFARLSSTGPVNLFFDQKALFKVTIGHEHTLNELLGFSKLIADGFLDKLSEKLETQAMAFQKTSKQIDSFVVQG